MSGAQFINFGNHRLDPSDAIFDCDSRYQQPKKLLPFIKG